MPPTYQQIVSGTNSAASTVTASSVAVGSGTDRSLVAFCKAYDASSQNINTFNSVIFNTSENFTKRASVKYLYGGNAIAQVNEIWTLDNPSNSTANVVATCDATADTLSIEVIEYTGANNGVGTNVGSATGNAATASCTFTTGLSTSLTLSNVIHVQADATFTPAYSETERKDAKIGTTNAYRSWDGEKTSSAASETTGCTSTVGGRFSITAIELKASAGASPQTITLTALTLAGSPQAATLGKGAVSLLMGTPTLVSSPQGLTLIKGGVNVPANTLSLVSSIDLSDVLPGGVNVPANSINLVGSPQALVVVGTGGFPQIVPISTVNLAGSIPVLIVVPGGVIIGLSSLTLQSAQQVASILPGAVSLLMSTMNLSSSIINISVVADETITLDTLIATSMLLSLVVREGAIDKGVTYRMGLKIGIGL